MIIKELVLKNFGKFSGVQFKFEDGINVIYGLNEAGKTTIYTAIGAMLFGLDKQRGRAAKTDAYTAYQPWENKTWYEGKMRFSIDGKMFLLERNFYHGEKSARLVCETDGEELSMEQGDLEVLLGDVNAELFYNTVAVGQLKTKPQDVIYSYLKNYIASVQENGSYGTDVVKALEILGNRKKELEQKQKKNLMKIRESLMKCDARLELLDKEIRDYQLQMEVVSKEKASLQMNRKKVKKSFWVKFWEWLKKLFLRNRLGRDVEERTGRLQKLEEKSAVYQELVAEREVLREEILLEKDFLYEKLQKPEDTQTLEAISLAMERIQQVSTVKKEEVMGCLLEKASEILCGITKGKYTKLMLQDGEKPVVWDGSRKLQLFQVSTGCVDQVYLALRIALQDLFFGEEQLPLIFDDAFVYFDEMRLECLLGYLQGFHRQVLLFSCHKREMELLEKRGISFREILL